MVEHVILFHFKKDLSSEQKHQAKHVIQDLLYLDCVYEGEVYLNDEKAEPSNADLSFRFRFSDWKDLEEYQGHPQHLAMKEELKDWIVSRDCIDYEVDEDSL